MWCDTLFLHVKKSAALEEKGKFAIMRSKFFGGAHRKHIAPPLTPLEPALFIACFFSMKLIQPI
jgi:hypothetical protein